MRKLIVFNHVTLDGYFVGDNGDMSWAHMGNDDPEFQEFVAGNASGESVLMFGRVTYDMMASYWPTPIADQHMPIVAKKMNETAKVVFSRTMDKALWSNTKLVKGNLVAEVKRMKQEEGPGIVILGSGNIVAQLAAEGLIDEYQVVLDPVVLGRGRTMFEGIHEMLSMKLTKTRSFNNGKIFLCFEAVK